MSHTISMPAVESLRKTDAFSIRVFPPDNGALRAESVFDERFNETEEEA